MLLCLLLPSILFADATNLISTPHGYRPSKCIIEHNEEAIIKQRRDGSGVDAFYPNSNKYKYFPINNECMDQYNGNNVGEWDIYAYYNYNTSANDASLSNFTSTYIVPNESPTCTNDIEYFFIALQNKNDIWQEVIVQSVVQYGCIDEYPHGWSMEPWSCCPYGQSHKGRTVVIKPGDIVKSWIYNINGQITIGMSLNSSNQTQIVVDESIFTFNYALTALSSDRIVNCDEYGISPFETTNLKITNNKGTIVKPQWYQSKSNQCNGT
eukprot:888221_1